jgi:hypothetical protein
MKPAALLYDVVGVAPSKLCNASLDRPHNLFQSGNANRPKVDWVGNTNLLARNTHAEELFVLL